MVVIRDGAIYAAICDDVRAYIRVVTKAIPISREFVVGAHAYALIMIGTYTKCTGTAISRNACAKTKVVTYLNHVKNFGDRRYDRRPYRLLYERFYA